MSEMYLLIWKNESDNLEELLFEYVTDLIKYTEDSLIQKFSISKIKVFLPPAMQVESLPERKFLLRPLSQGEDESPEIKL